MCIRDRTNARISHVLYHTDHTYLFQLSHKASSYLLKGYRIPFIHVSSMRESLLAFAKVVIEYCQAQFFSYLSVNFCRPLSFDVATDSSGAVFVELLFEGSSRIVGQIKQGLTVSDVYNITRQSLEAHTVLTHDFFTLNFPLKFMLLNDGTLKLYNERTWAKSILSILKNNLIDNTAALKSDSADSMIVEDASNLEDNINQRLYILSKLPVASLNEQKQKAMLQEIFSSVLTSGTDYPEFSSMLEAVEVFEKQEFIELPYLHTLGKHKISLAQKLRIKLRKESNLHNAVQYRAQERNTKIAKNLFDIKETCFIVANVAS
eukprot:TRINITY_DN5582_c0_g1_i10.p1 TRINITY_DN5582_c0_g1~~TRINITY_DN5582_c0_g1_i10.p1  ORF type:complete len:319 (+),score=32.77 TRINITY_DN5582_c0_g1_i10:70-1026(+)